MKQRDITKKKKKTFEESSFCCVNHFAPKNRNKVLYSKLAEVFVLQKGESLFFVFFSCLFLFHCTLLNVGVTLTVSHFLIFQQPIFFFFFFFLVLFGRKKQRRWIVRYTMGRIANTWREEEGGREWWLLMQAHTSD